MEFAGGQGFADHPVGGTDFGVELFAAAHGDGGDQPHVVVDHQLDYLIGEKIAVLYAVQSTFDCVPNRAGWTGVGSDFLAGAVRGFHDRAHLVFGELRIADGFVFAGDAAGDADFDEVGAGFELLPHHSAESVGSVGFNGAAAAMTVASGGDARHAGGKDSWTHCFATRDRGLECEIGVLALSGQADGGHAGQQRFTGVLGHAEGQGGFGFVLHTVAGYTGQDQTEVHVHVEEAGQDVGAGQIYGVCARWWLEGAGWADGGNAVVLDQDGGIGGDSAGDDVYD